MRNQKRDLLVTICKRGKKNLLARFVYLMISGSLFIGGGVMLTTSGCALWPFEEDIVVPDYPTAREQAEVAQIQYKRSRRAYEKTLKKDELEKTAAGFQKVLTNFPENRVYTPACAILLGNIFMEMEKYKKAESVFKSAIDNYQDIDDIHSGALFGMANCLGRQNQIEEENQYYRRLIEGYSTSNNPEIARQVSIANRRLKRIERRK